MESKIPEPLEDLRPKIKIHPVKMKRITGWAAECFDDKPGCGLQVARNRQKAWELAVAHAKAKHQGMANTYETQ